VIAPGRAAGAGLLAASVTLLVLLLAPLVLNADGFLEAVHNGVTKYFPTGLRRGCSAWASAQECWAPAR